jgi:hypothetical protein
MGLQPVWLERKMNQHPPGDKILIAGIFKKVAIR